MIVRESTAKELKRRMWRLRSVARRRKTDADRWPGGPCSRRTLVANGPVISVRLSTRAFAWSRSNADHVARGRRTHRGLERARSRPARSPCASQWRWPRLSGGTGCGCGSPSSSVPIPCDDHARNPCAWADGAVRGDRVQPASASASSRRRRQSCPTLAAHWLRSLHPRHACGCGRRDDGASLAHRRHQAPLSLSAHRPHWSPH